MALVGFIGGEHGGLGRQGHDGVLELEFDLPSGALDARCDHHQGSGDYRHDGHSI